MKKKFLLATLTMILCISALGTLTACGEKHTHSYVESITTPTCTEQGFSTYTCECGHSYVENYVNALGHTEVVDSAVAPTCTEAGLTEGKHCSVCNEIITAQQPVGATGHSFLQENTADKYLKSVASCEDKAVYYKSCSCGEKGTETFEYGQALGHTYDQENTASKYLKTEATCKNVAVYWKSCVCGLISTTETFNYGSTIPHDFGTYSKTQNATCTENAKETAYCQSKDCNEPDVRDIEGTVLGHSDINTNNICSVCNKEVAYSKGMVYVAVTGGYQLIDMGSATDADIIIPKYYNGSPVISIADDVFANKTSLTSISLPDTIISIGDSAFYGCSNIKELILPESVKSIGYTAFARCVSLEYLTIPCLQVESSFSAGYMFDQPLTELFMEAKIKKSYIPSDATYVYSEAITSSTTYYYYWYKPENLKKITVLGTVENIPEKAFYCFDMVEEIELPNTIKTIGNHAFRYCSSLKSINIPDSVTSIGNSAFGSCYNLKEVKLGTGLIEIDGFAFQSCTSLTEIVIPASVNSINIYAFSGCSQLNKIIFKNTSGWKVGGNSIDVSNASTNAILFKKTYVSSSWSRS